MSDKKFDSYVMKELPEGWNFTAQRKIRETCVQMELSGSVRETENTKIKADDGLMTCRKTRERFLQSEVCDADNLGLFAEQMAVQYAEGESKLYCAIDGTSLNIPDSTGNKGMGNIGSNSIGAKGLIVQNSYLIGHNGIPCGILYQKYYVRPANVSESEIWANTLEKTIAILSRNHLSHKTIIVMDRGYDCPNILDFLRTKNVKIMIRGTQDRSVCNTNTNTPEEARKSARPVLDYMSGVPVMATLEVTVPKVLRDKETPAGTSNTYNAPLRNCTLALKTAPVKIFLRPKKYRDPKVAANVDESKREWLSSATVVLAEEVDTPSDCAPVRWLLWLNYEVNSPEKLKEVISDYHMRWRIEEFHKIWKSSGTNVEKTQARSAQMIERVARISAVVASNLARMQRILELNPEAPATTCFSVQEIRDFELIDERYYRGRLGKKHGLSTLAFVMALFAKAGGYEQGSKSKVGAKMLTRGYRNVMDVIAGMRIMRTIQKE